MHDRSHAITQKRLNSPRTCQNGTLNADISLNKQRKTLKLKWESIQSVTHRLI